jgi:N-acetylmuramoyl-L-alanine amidase
MSVCLGWDDIGYSIVLGEDGRAYMGRGWNVQGAHTLHYNSISLGFCVIGNFMQQLPTRITLEALTNIMACGVQLVGTCSIDMNE